MWYAGTCPDGEFLRKASDLSTSNLLFLFTDEQRADTLAAYGNDRIEMPNLNRLASESVVFDRAYVTQPVCTPSRASILTGLYPHTNGCTENNAPLAAEVPTIAQMLSDDCTTAYFGKWHLGDEIFRQHGFDEWRSIEDMYIPHYSAGRDPSARSDYHHWLVDKGYSPANASHFTRSETARLPEDLSKPAYLAEETSRFIREQKDRRWCLFVNFLEPHMPFFGPRDGQYDPTEITLPANFDKPPAADQPLKTRLFQRHYCEKGHGGRPLRTDDDWRDLISKYWGLCSLVDTHVGTILRTLAECGLDGNTIVVFTSDHGDMMGSHRLLAKCVMFEEAVRVPMLIRLPGERRARRVSSPVSQIDLVPTLLDLMDQPVSETLEGTSLRPLMESKRTASARDVFIEWNGPNSGIAADVLGRPELPEHLTEIASVEDASAAITDPVRSVVTADGWKFNASPRGEHELYDLNADPLETTNLAFLRESEPRIEDLLSRIRAWQQRTGDEIPLPGPPYTCNR